MAKKPEYWCPRREETGSRAYGPDAWNKRKGSVICSYCGSMQPDEFMGLARSGAAEIGPTDKSYKVYVEAGDGVFRKFYFQHLSDEQKQEFVELYNARPKRVYNDSLPPLGAGDGVPLQLTPTFTQEDGTGMAVGYPGHFYVLPFFMKRG